MMKPKTFYFACITATACLLIGGAIFYNPAPPVVSKLNPEYMKLYNRREMIARLRFAMKDPDSFEIIDALVTKQDTLCFRYQATNGFGARVPGYAAIDAEFSLWTKPSDYRKLCNKKRGKAHSLKKLNRLNFGSITTE